MTKPQDQDTILLGTAFLRRAEAGKRRVSKAVSGWKAALAQVLHTIHSSPHPQASCSQGWPSASCWEHAALSWSVGGLLYPPFLSGSVTLVLLGGGRDA